MTPRGLSRLPPSGGVLGPSVSGVPSVRTRPELRWSGESCWQTSRVVFVFVGSPCLCEPQPVGPRCRVDGDSHCPTEVQVPVVEVHLHSRGRVALSAFRLQCLSRGTGRVHRSYCTHVPRVTGGGALDALASEELSSRDSLCVCCKKVDYEPFGLYITTQ